MNELKTFENAQFGQVRGIERDGEPWFVAVDVCNALGIGNSRMAVAKLDDDEKGVNLTDTLGGKQELTIVNESGLDSLVLGSRKPEAKAFKRWITHDVIPSIRKTGGYIASAPEETPEEIMARALVVAQETINRHKVQLEAAQAKIEADAPKVLFAETVSKAEGNILVREMAKILKQHGYDTGEHRLYETLKRDGFIIKAGADRNMPTQKSMNMGLMRITERTIGSGDQTFMRRTATVTGKGQIYFLQRYAGVEKAVEA